MPTLHPAAMPVTPPTPCPADARRTVPGALRRLAGLGAGIAMLVRDPGAAVRRRGSLALAAVVGLSVLAAPGVAAVSDVPAPHAAAEAHLLDLVVDARHAAGLVAYRTDGRLMAVARARAADMAATGQFAHTTSTGQSVFDLLSAEGIAWNAAAEAIAWNSGADDMSSAALAASAWMASPGHRAILLAPDLNYVGVGLAISPATGTRYWAAIAIRGPDRTGAVGRMRSARLVAGDTQPGTRRVAVAWAGADPRLQVLTAGLRDFSVQRRVDGGAWVTIRSSTTATGLVQSVARGHVVEYRVRARDRRGNAGRWSAPLAIRT